MDQWTGKVAVVTGASSGIGAEVASALANAGLIVVGLARRQELIQDIANRITGSGRLFARGCDITDEAEVKSTFEWIRSQHGTMHILVNNAGMMSSGFLIDYAASVVGGGVDQGMERLRRTFDVNVTAACVVIREAKQMMLMGGERGHVVLINSILGHRIPDVPVPLFNIYPATKYALNGLSQVFRQELRFLGRTNIKFTCISPGMVDTDMLSRAFREGGLKAVPKLRTEDVMAAVRYALETPPHVQVNDIILEAVSSDGPEGGSN